MQHDLEAMLNAALSTLREMHHRQPDAIILASDLTSQEDRQGADKIDPRLVENILAESARTGTIPLFFTTVSKSDLMDEEADKLFIEKMPLGHFGVIMLGQQDYVHRLYLPE